MSTATDRQQIYVTDPAPSPPGDRSKCEFKLYPNPDAVEFCDQPAAAVLTAFCCGAETPICRDCMGKCRGLGTWLCMGCGLRTDCQWTPLEMKIRWLR